MHPGSRRSGVFVSIMAVACLGLDTPAGATEEPRQTTPAELRLVSVDLCDTAPGLRHGALREIQALLEPVGVRVTGRTAAAAEGREGGGVYVVFLPFDPSRARTEPVGGVARHENGRQLTVWVFPPWVAGGLGLDLGVADVPGARCPTLSWTPDGRWLATPASDRPLVESRGDPRHPRRWNEPRPTDRRPGIAAGQPPVVARRPMDRFRLAAVQTGLSTCS